MIDPLRVGVKFSQPKLSIIIVSWNCWLYLEKCLRSIFSSPFTYPYEVIVIDNASRDGTKDKIEKMYPEVKLISNEKNVGFPRACNQGLSQAQGEYFLLLNPDTELAPDTLEKSLSLMDKNPQISLLGVKIRLPNGRIQLHGGRAFPTLLSLLANALGLDRALARLKIFPSVDLADWDHANSREVDMISGTFMLFRRQLYEELGGLDETLPMFFEDMEFCWRIKRAGGQIYYLAETEIVHHTSQSSSRAPSFWVTSLKYEANQLMLQRMGKIFQSKVYPLAILFFTPLRALLLPLWLFFLKKRGLSPQPHLYLREVFHAGLWSIQKIGAMTF